jgi:hypothetical protein
VLQWCTKIVGLTFGKYWERISMRHEHNVAKMKKKIGLRDINFLQLYSFLKLGLLQKTDIYISTCFIHGSFASEHTETWVWKKKSGNLTNFLVVTFCKVFKTWLGFVVPQTINHLIQTFGYRTECTFTSIDFNEECRSSWTKTALDPCVKMLIFNCQVDMGSFVIITGVPIRGH